jgi:hypothetical protein
MEFDNEHYEEDFNEDGYEQAAYLPEYVPHWERLLGPGAMAASVIAIILAIMAMIITYTAPQQITQAMKVDKPEVLIEPKDKPKLDVDVPLIKVPKKFEEVFPDPPVPEVDNETPDDVDFKETLKDDTEITDVIFSKVKRANVLGPNGKTSRIKGFRRGGKRLKLIQGDGDRYTEDAVLQALRWLRRHQANNGSWSLEHYLDHCGGEGKRGKCAGIGETKHDEGASAMALLAYTGYGLDHKTVSEFRTTIIKSMKHLKGIQKSDGCFGKPEGEHLYNQALATFALADLLMMSEDDSLKPYVQKGVDYILDAQNSDGEGGWRYNDYKKHPEALQETLDGIKNDTSVTTWMVMALKTAKGCGLKVDPKGYDGAKRWLDNVYNEKEVKKYHKNGTFAYNLAPNDLGVIKPAFIWGREYATTACGVLARQFMAQSKGVIPGCNTLLKALPKWGDEDNKASRDMYYWYYGSLAMFQMGGDHWDQWNQALKPTLCDNQNNTRSLCLFGSWDPEGTVWGDEAGGRVYTTAIGALTLEVYYRYSKIEKKK